MKNNNFNLNGTITICYNNEILMGSLQYRLLNLVIADSILRTVTDELNITKQKAILLINNMNKLAPYPVTEIEKGKYENHHRVTDFGMRLLNSYAQKEFDLYMFLKKSDEHLNNSFMNCIEEKNSLTSAAFA
jgi:molybdenum-dependent DNA-binding transcriptional regulator ModE